MGQRSAAGRASIFLLILNGLVRVNGAEELTGGLGCIQWQTGKETEGGCEVSITSSFST